MTPRVANSGGTEQRMRKLLGVSCLVFFAGLGGTHLAGQGLVITNARIIPGLGDGSGGMIERGSVVVRDGRIVSVSAGAATAPGARVIDAQGRTVMPGFIDSHRHLMQGDGAQWLKDQATARMQEFLD